MTKNSAFSSRIMTNSTEEPVSNEQAFSLGNSGISIAKDNKSSKNSRFNVAQNFLEDGNTNKEFDIEKEIEEASALKAAHDQRVKSNKWVLSDRSIDIAFIIGCVYFCVLTFGVWVTDYRYDETGKIIAQQMTYKDLEEKKSFEILLDQYLTCRNLYEKTLFIDKKLASGETKALALAPEYELIVKEAENLYLKTDALSLEAQYEQVRAMLLSWLKEDLATYCKNMSIAISQNNETVANTALTNRKSTYSDFSQITQNIIAMGDSVTGVDLVNIKEWNEADIYKEKNNGNK